MLIVWPWLLSAVGLVLMLEGLLPLINPRGWRAMFDKLLRLRDGQLRFMGLLSLLLGAGLLLLSKF